MRQKNLYGIDRIVKVNMTLKYGQIQWLNNFYGTYFQYPILDTDVVLATALPHGFTTSVAILSIIFQFTTLRKLIFAFWDHFWKHFPQEYL